MRSESGDPIVTRWMPLVLQGGATLACVILAVGYLMQLLGIFGVHSSQEDYLSLYARTADPITFTAYPIQATGLCLLLLTPVFRLFLTLAHFMRQKDYPMAVFPLISLGFIFAGILYGATH